MFGIIPRRHLRGEQAGMFNGWALGQSAQAEEDTLILYSSHESVVKNKYICCLVSLVYSNNMSRALATAKEDALLRHVRALRPSDGCAAWPLVRVQGAYGAALRWVFRRSSE